MEFIKRNVYGPDFTVYVFGKDNYKQVIDLGFNAKLVDERSIIWPIATAQFRHKFEVFKAASQDFDEFVFLDWDMAFVKPMPSDFWDVLAKGNEFQAVLRQYHRRKAHWRKEELRKIPCGSFNYVRGKEVPIKLIETWEKHNTWSEEINFARYTDELMGGFNVDKWYKRFEAPYFHFGACVRKDITSKKPDIVQHFGQTTVNRFLIGKYKAEYFK